MKNENRNSKTSSLNNSKVLLVTLSIASEKARIKRNIKSFERLGYEVDVLDPGCVDNSETKFPLVKPFVKLMSLLLLPLVFLGSKFALTWYLKLSYPLLRRLQEKIHSELYAIVFVEEVELLPVVVLCRQRMLVGFKVVVDLRDFYWFDNTLTKGIFKDLHGLIRFPLKFSSHHIRRFIYKKYLNSADLIFVVSDGHKRKLKKILGLDSVLIFNAAYYHDGIKPSSKDFTVIKFVYHGLAGRRRSIETIINVFNTLPKGYELHLYLVSEDPVYLAELKSCAGGSIVFHDPVAQSELIHEASGYDVGISYFLPLSSTLEDVLPNKFFEYIQSRLALLVSPSWDMAQLVENNGIGVVAEDYSSKALREAILKFDKNLLNSCRYQSELIAYELSFETEFGKFRDSIRKLSVY